MLFRLRKDQLKLFFCSLFIFSNTLFSQTNSESIDPPGSKSNLEIFYILTDSSAANLIKNIPGEKKEVILQLNLGNEYSILGNKIISSLQENNFFVSVGSIKHNEVSPQASPTVNFVIDNAGVQYGEMFRNGFLGDYLIPRKIFLSGNYMVDLKGANYNAFNFNFADTIRVDEIKNLENLSFPFTQGEVPIEPFFSGLLEPVIAIGTAAVAVFLFFSIRSR